MKKYINDYYEQNISKLFKFNISIKQKINKYEQYEIIKNKASKKNIFQHRRTKSTKKKSLRLVDNKISIKIDNIKEDLIKIKEIHLYTRPISFIGLKRKAELINIK